MNIGIIGCGYVGLTNAAILAHTEKIFLYDIDEKKLEMIRKRRSPFCDKALKEVMNKDYIEFSCCSSERELIENTDIIIIAVPTDYDSENNCLNTHIIETIIDLIVKMGVNKKIIIRSTVPVGFTDQIKRRYDYSGIFFMPEFLREGSAYIDALNPERVIIGGEKCDANKFAMVFLNAMRKAGGKLADVLYTETSEAEAIKLFSNAFLAMRVSFFNELDMFAEKRGLDSKKLIQGVCSDSRIGNYYNSPSFGYGGYCLPKDTMQVSSELGLDGILIEAISKSNEHRKEYITNKINLIDGRIGIYRLQAKRGSDNFRNSVTLDVVQMLIDRGRTVYVYEPMLKNMEIDKNINLVNSLEELDAKCSVIVANRYMPELKAIKSKVYTRDL